MFERKIILNDKESFRTMFGDNKKVAEKITWLLIGDFYNAEELYLHVTEGDPTGISFGFVRAGECKLNGMIVVRENGEVSTHT